MSDITMIGPVSKKLRQKLKIFLAETGVSSYEGGLTYLLHLYEQEKSKE